jgi:hypothetical protein
VSFNVEITGTADEDVTLHASTSDTNDVMTVTGGSSFNLGGTGIKTVACIITGGAGSDSVYLIASFADGSDRDWSAKISITGEGDSTYSGGDAIAVETETTDKSINVDISKQDTLSTPDAINDWLLIEDVTDGHIHKVSVDALLKAISSYNGSNKQFLFNNAGTLKWQDTSTCPA